VVLQALSEISVLSWAALRSAGDYLGDASLDTGRQGLEPGSRRRRRAGGNRSLVLDTAVSMASEPSALTCGPVSVTDNSHAFPSSVFDPSRVDPEQADARILVVDDGPER
jgi:hypothetical protein